ncbi:MAG: hypothetical protein KDK70_01065 [Myxococcales bacterium]|nr:hypothetical protein [Myxococcales bacterium]
MVLGCADADDRGPGQEYTSIPEQDAGRTFGRELCYLMLDGCDCSRQFFSMDQCVDAMIDQLDQSFAEAQAAGLVYDPVCMAEYVNLHTQQLGCSTLSELTGDVLGALDVPPCKVHSGQGQEGEACQMYPLAMGDDCAPELRCLGTCMVVPTLTARVEGEVCDPQTDRCEPGTACLPAPDDPVGVSSCLRLPGEGQPCTYGCDVGLTCELTADGSAALCVAPPGEGQPCGSYPYECAAGNYCDANVCTKTLAQGQPCGAFPREACGVGFECDELEDGGEEVCVPEEAYLCI